MSIGCFYTIELKKMCENAFASKQAIAQIEKKAE